MVSSEELPNEGPKKNLEKVTLDIHHGNYTDKYIGFAKTIKEGEKFIREGLGIYIYNVLKKGMLLELKYIGNFEDNFRKGLGLLHAPSNYLYFGKFENDVINGNGIFFWENEKGGYTICFSGEFLDGSISKGIMYHKPDERESENNNEVKKYLYIGSFLNNQKKDDNGFLYDFDKNYFFFGKFEGDRAVEGYEIFPEESSNNVYYFQLLKENTIKEIKLKDAIEEDIVSQLLSMVEEFKNNYINKSIIAVISEIFLKLTEISKQENIPSQELFDELEIKLPKTQNYFLKK